MELAFWQFVDNRSSGWLSVQQKCGGVGRQGTVPRMPRVARGGRAETAVKGSPPGRRAQGSWRASRAETPVCEE